MAHMNDYIRSFMDRYSYPDEAVRVFTETEKLLDENEKLGAEVDSVYRDYMFPEAHGLNEALDKLKDISERYSINVYTLHFVFLMNCTEELKKRYEAKGIPLDIFYASMDDFCCKLNECIECKGVPGTFVADWYGRFFEMTRFALGRFQYETQIHDGDDITLSCGHVIKKGDLCINMHIPSSGVSLTDEVRFNSYKKAYEFYSPLFSDGKVIFCCHSWLLYPPHREFLPKNLNILKFMNDFEIVEQEDRDGFPNDWRVFGHYAGLPYDELPRDTSLRKAYAEWLSSGHCGGNGQGYFVFDGEKIIR